MRALKVGGAVRDALLGRPIHERDWVVLGETPETMEAQGYRPVGREFPVFLHPLTGEEYALARTERKTARGHQGFQFFASPEITLEEDLIRRDLTINAMAQDEQGVLVDPYGGLADLHGRWLRHVSPAFQEDPLRVLRVARFAAELAPFGFRIAPETEALMAAMAASGELASLSSERRWRELTRAVAAPGPARFFASLQRCGALAPCFPFLAEAPEAGAILAGLAVPLPLRGALLWAEAARRQGVDDRSLLAALKAQGAPKRVIQLAQALVRASVVFSAKGRTADALLAAVLALGAQRQGAELEREQYAQLATALLAWAHGVCSELTVGLGALLDAAPALLRELDASAALQSLPPSERGPALAAARRRVLQGWLDAHPLEEGA